MLPACELAIKICGTVGQTSCYAAYVVCNSMFSKVMALVGDKNYYDIRKKCEGDLCYDFSNMENFLQQKSVKDALGVGKIDFVSCSPSVHEAMMMDWMRNLEVGIPGLLEDGIKMLIYAGEYDLICNWLGNSRWVHAMEWSGQKDFVGAPGQTGCFQHERRCSTSFSSRSTINKNIYQDVFGPNYEQRSRSMDFSGRDECLVNVTEKKELDTDEENIKQGVSVHNTKRIHRRSSSQDYKNVKAQMSPEISKSNYSRFFLCRTELSADSINKRHIAKDDATSMRKPSHYLPSSDFSSVVTTMCTSYDLSNCEISVRVIAKAWLDSHGDPILESVLSNVYVIDGMLEVVFASNDDEILELVISILAELVSRNQANKEIVLKSDPQLEIFMKLLRSSSLFLKSSILFYLLKPKAKQMLSVDWVPLILRVASLHSEETGEEMSEGSEVARYKPFIPLEMRAQKVNAHIPSGMNDFHPCHLISLARFLAHFLDI